MFSPDVWTFLPPHVNKQENKGNIFEKDSFVHSLIEPHYYNHSVSIYINIKFINKINIYY